MTSENASRSLAIACSAGGFKGVFVHGVLTALEAGSIRAAAYGAASSSVFPTLCAAAGLAGEVGLRYWRGALETSKTPGKGMSEVALLIIPVAIVENLIADGVPEEFAFRGVLMTRMVSLLGAQWGIVLSSLFFGIYHISNYMDQLHVDALTALAACLALPALMGIFLAFILQRTRNLLFGVFVHANIDAMFNAIPPLLPWLH